MARTSHSMPTPSRSEQRARAILARLAAATDASRHNPHLALRKFSWERPQ